MIVCCTFLLHAECFVNGTWWLWRKGQALHWGKLSEIHWKVKNCSKTPAEHFPLDAAAAIRCKSNFAGFYLCMASFPILKIIIQMNKHKQTTPKQTKATKPPINQQTKKTPKTGLVKFWYIVEKQWHCHGSAEIWQIYSGTIQNKRESYPHLSI